MRELHFVLPNDIDDPARPSGGNVYDRRMISGLAGLGRTAVEHPVPGSWPLPSRAQMAGLHDELASIASDSVTVVDGLVASAAPEVLRAHAPRLKLVVLVHMPQAGPEEVRALQVARAVVTTSAWSRGRLLELYGLPPDLVHVVAPGVDPRPLVRGSQAGGRLLCVAGVLPHKGHDLLAQALAIVGDLPFHLTCVGSRDLDPGYAAEVEGLLGESGVRDRVSFTGPLRGAQLDAQYARADLLVVASRAESYGMVVTEALAAGVPVLAGSAQGLPEALGRTPRGQLPGMLVEPNDPAALGWALRRWLVGEELRGELRLRARERRATLSGWPLAGALLDAVLAEVEAGRECPRCVEDFADKP